MPGTLRVPCMIFRERLPLILYQDIPHAGLDPVFQKNPICYFKSYINMRYWRRQRG